MRDPLNPISELEEALASYQAHVHAISFSPLLLLTSSFVLSLFSVLPPQSLGKSDTTRLYCLYGKNGVKCIVYS